MGRPWSSQSSAGHHAPAQEQFSCSCSSVLSWSCQCWRRSAHLKLLPFRPFPTPLHPPPSFFPSPPFLSFPPLFSFTPPTPFFSFLTPATPRQDVLPAPPPGAAPTPLSLLHQDNLVGEDGRGAQAGANIRGILQAKSPNLGSQTPEQS